MREPNRVILDTSALLALLDADDEFHSAATETYLRLLTTHELWLSSYLHVETYALVQRRLGFEPLRALMAGIDAMVSTVWIEQVLHQEVWEEYVIRKGERLSFVDCSTVIIARMLGAAIFTFDTDFALEGLSVIP